MIAIRIIRMYEFSMTVNDPLIIRFLSIRRRLIQHIVEGHGL